MITMRKMAHFLMLSSAAALLSSCNTFIGMGRDIENLGVGMQNTSEGKTWYGEPRKKPQPAPTPSPHEQGNGY